MRVSRQDVLVLPVATMLIVLVDQITKYIVATRLVEGQSLVIAPWLASVFRVTYVTNTGVVFGLLPGLGDLFIGVAVLVAIAIVVYYWHLPRGQWALRIALGLQLGGTLGNLIDRLRQGFVTDFIDLNFWPLQNWAIFNLADSAIVSGVTILALLMVWEEWREREEQRLIVSRATERE